MRSFVNALLLLLLFSKQWAKPNRIHGGIKDAQPEEGSWIRVRIVLLSRSMTKDASNSVLLPSELNKVLSIPSS